MSNTTLISLRIPDALLAEIDAEAAREERSRSQVIAMRLRTPAKPQPTKESKE
jgi:metal-responsive CopG/Arc/MetJ family transcriptional regulator